MLALQLWSVSQFIIYKYVRKMYFGLCGLNVAKLLGKTFFCGIVRGCKFWHSNGRVSAVFREVIYLVQAYLSRWVIVYFVKSISSVINHYFREEWKSVFNCSCSSVMLKQWVSRNDDHWFFQYLNEEIGAKLHVMM